MTTHEQTLQQLDYQHIGDKGKHRNHHLVSDDMGDVWCQTCQAWLDDGGEAETAWSVETS